MISSQILPDSRESIKLASSIHIAPFPYAMGILTEISDISCTKLHSLIWQIIVFEP